MSEKICLTNIPAALRGIKKWAGFLIENGKKTPVSILDSKRVGANDFDRLVDFKTASAAYAAGTVSAIGVSLLDEEYTCIDIDCHDEEKRALFEEINAEILGQFKSYAETSISGLGTHIFVKGQKPEGYKHCDKYGIVEVYDNARFIVVTGNVIEGHDTYIAISQDELNALCEKHLVKKESFVGLVGKGVYEKSDEQVLEKLKSSKKGALFLEGRWAEVEQTDATTGVATQAFPSQSEADMSFISTILYYNGNNAAQAERIFLKSGMWSEKRLAKKSSGYVQHTIAEASAKCSKVYNWDGASVTATQPTDISSEWKPDFTAIRQKINDGAIADPALKDRILAYMAKYYGTNIRYFPNLHLVDRNVNGYTKIVHQVLGDKLMFSNKLQSFYNWNGKKYEQVDEEALYHLITEVLAMVEHSVFMWVADNLFAPAKVDDAQVIEKKALDYFNACTKAVSIKNCQDVFKKLKGMYYMNDLLDYQESPYINMQNGVLDLTAKAFLPHDTQYRLHKLMGCDYDPSATCPVFEDMISSMFPDTEVRREVQKAFGLCLAKEQLPAKKVLLLLYGKPDTGKTTLVNCLNEVFGDYGKSIDNTLLMKSHTAKSNVGPEILAMYDTLFISTSELDKESRLDSSRVKAMTGNTILSTRNLYDRKMITFSLIGLIAIDTNWKPAISNDDAMWNRLRVYEFTQIVKNKDKTLPKKLSAEKAGIFNWLLEGLRMVLEDGALFEPPVMLAAKEQYKSEMTVMEQFISDCMVVGLEETDRVQTTKVFETYTNWCKDNGFYAVIRNKFYTEIMGYLERKKSGVEYFVGTALSPLGLLYSHMKEKTPQQFAKDKRKIIDSAEPEVGYDVLRKVYYQRTQQWFADHVESTTYKTALFDQYSVYAEWCIRQGILPLVATDFNSKVRYLHDNLQTNKPTPDLLEKAAGQWD